MTPEADRIARIDWLTLRWMRRELDSKLDVLHLETGEVTDDEHADRAPGVEELAKYAWRSTRYHLLDGRLRDSDDTVIGTLSHRHGGLQLALPGDYWRNHHDPSQLHQLLVAIGAGQVAEWEPTHMTAVRVDWAIEEDYPPGWLIVNPITGTVDHGVVDAVDTRLASLARALAPRLELLHPHRAVTTTRTASDDGITYAVGYAPAGTMRRREIYARCYSYFVDRTIRVEIEQKKLDGEDLRQQLTNARDRAQGLLGAHCAMPEGMPSTDAPARSDAGMLDMLDRTIGCYLAAAQRHVEGVKRSQIEHLEAAVGAIIGTDRAKARIARAVKRKGVQIDD